MTHMPCEIKAADLRRVTPPLLAAYLEAKGWRATEDWRGRIMVWSKDGVDEDVLVPLRPRSDTYALRIAEALDLLARLEGHSRQDVYRDLLAARPATAGGQA